MRRYNYILVVGNTEVVGRTVNVRVRSGAELGERSIDDFLAHITAERAAHGVGFAEPQPAGAAPAADGVAAPNPKAPKPKAPKGKSSAAAPGAADPSE